MGFDPDKYLAAKKVAPAAPVAAFNPDAYLASKEPEESDTEGELGLIDRMHLSFASNEEERRGLLEKNYPGIKILDQNRVQLPGEAKPKYIDSPKTSLTDLADFAGDVPSMALGAMGGLAGSAAAPFVGPAAAVGGLMAGAGAGEALKKKLAHDMLGIPNKQAPNEQAEDIAMMALLAPVFEAGGSSVMKVAGKGVNKVGGLLRSVKDRISGLLPKGAQESFETMKSAVSTAEKSGAMPELPQMAEIEAAERLLPDLTHKVSPVQKSMYRSKQDRDMINTLRTLPSEEGQNLSKYEMLQKKELGQKLVGEIDNIAPGHVASATPEEAGTNFLKRVTDKHKAEQIALKPVFDAIDNAPVRAAKSHLASLRMVLGNTFSFMDGVSYGPGGIKLPPYSSKLGVSKQVYGILSDIAGDLSDPSLTVKNLRAMRESLRQSVGPEDAGYEIVMNLRKGILSHIDNIVSEVSPNLHVRDTMKRWAVNEGKKDMLEQVLGGSLDAFAPITKKVKAEKVLSRMFGDTNTVKLAKEVLGPEEFNKLAVDYVTQNIQAVSHNGFSPQKFSSFLRSRGPIIREAFSDNPQALEKIHGITNMMRLIPDAPPGNPSGTNVAKNWTDWLLDPQGTAIKEGAGLLKRRGERKAAKNLAKNIEQRAGTARVKKRSSKSGLIGASKTKDQARNAIDQQRDGEKDE